MVLKGEERMLQLKNSMEELLSAKAAATTSSPSHNEKILKWAVEKNVRQHESYSCQRVAMAKKDASSFFSPRWCSPLENCFLWLGGCRPSMGIRLLYTLTGLELDRHLEEFLRGARSEVSDLSAHQMSLINELHLRVMREEHALSSRSASLQEDIADLPFVPMSLADSAVDEKELDGAFAAYERSLALIIEQADELRLEMLKGLVSILTPSQAVDYLIAAKQLQIFIRKWCSRRDSRIVSPAISAEA
ncbi:protein DOG1-like 3 [Wolffia australiana]